VIAPGEKGPPAAARKEYTVILDLLRSVLEALAVVL
jgi:hypothetical protein